MTTHDISDIGSAFEAYGDDDSALVQTVGGQWTIALVQSKPFAEAPDYGDDIPYGALAVAQFIAAACSHYAANPPAPPQPENQ